MLVEVISFSAAVGALLAGLFIVVDGVNGFPVVRHSALRLANSFTKYERYKVVSADASGSYAEQFSLTLDECGMLIPVACDAAVYARLRDLLKLNGPDREVFVKAKIDSKRLKLVSVKGYNVK